MDQVQEIQGRRPDRLEFGHPTLRHGVRRHPLRDRLTDQTCNTVLPARVSTHLRGKHQSLTHHAIELPGDARVVLKKM